MEPLNKDLIIIGSGISGLSAAIAASLAELDVLILERAENAGSSMPVDELAYPHSLKKIIVNFQTRDDILTPLSRRAFWIATPDGYSSWECVKSPSDNGYEGFVASRPELDFSLAERLRTLGCEILTGNEATSLIRNSCGDVSGVRVAKTDTEYRAPLTIIAEGSSAPLTDHLLERRPLLENESVFVAREEYVGENPLPSFIFTGNENHAASIIILGDPLEVGFSWARIIAWKNRLVLKIYVPLDLMRSETGIKPMLESFKMHPAVEPYLKYLHRQSLVTSVIPTGGFDNHTEHLWGDGFIVTGKAARLYHPFDCRMTDYSIMSGLIAGQAAVLARHGNQPDHPSDYPRLLENSFIIPDRNSMAAFMHLLKTRKGFSSSYPDALLKIIDGIFTMDERTKRDKKKDIEREMRRTVSPWDISKDFYNLFKTYG